MNALVVHAHPDDELLFAGALMQAHPDWTWTTVCMTRNEQSDRYPGLILGHRDEWRILTNAEYEAWRTDLASQALKPDIVFTHNLLGEYGHPHHMAVHAMVHELYPNVWDFLCDAPSSVGPQARGLAVWEIPAGVDKRRRFVDRYGADVLIQLTNHQPDLIREVFTRERFTGSGPLPA